MRKMIFWSAVFLGGCMGFFVCAAGCSGKDWILSLIGAALFILAADVARRELERELLADQLDDEPEIEGRCEPWESLGDVIQRWHKKR